MNRNHIMFKYQSKSDGGGKGKKESATADSAKPATIKEEQTISGLIAYFGIKDITTEERYSARMNEIQENEDI